MQLDKSQIIDLLKSQGDQGKADQAAQQLPDKVDTDQHQDLLAKLGINPADLIGKLAGSSGGAEGLLGKVGL